MNNKYLIRLDDACPMMNQSNWERMFNILDHFGICPLVGIIPQNEDPETCIDSADLDFWNKVRVWEQKGWTLALHGFNHVCITNIGGLNPVHKRSEFAGLLLEQQKEKIQKGYEILKGKGFDIKWFFAPSHTFDENTLIAIKQCTPIKYISDMIATKPYKANGLIFVPCQMGRFREMPLSGYWCACYHPNVMKDEEFVALEQFLSVHKDEFISFNNLPEAGNKSIKDQLLSFIYYSLRRIKG